MRFIVKSVEVLYLHLSSIVRELFESFNAWFECREMKQGRGSEMPTTPIYATQSDPREFDAGAVLTH